MAKLFISHSSKDKPFVERLSQKLREAGHSIWLDKTAIQVGDSIPVKISEGLDGCDFVILVLSKFAVESKWVESEWTAKYWDQISEKKRLILPILLEDCVRPTFIKTLKYADFRESFDSGLAELLDAFRPPIASTATHVTFPTSAHIESISVLLAKVNDNKIPVSLVLVQALALAQKIGASELDSFCREELKGGSDEFTDTEACAKTRSWRVLEGFASKVGKLNEKYIGFQSADGLFEFIEAQPEKFVPIKCFWGQSVAEIETNDADKPPMETALILKRKHGEMVADSKTPGTLVYLYFRPDCLSKMLNSIRRELLARLLSLLPSTFSS